ncbi:MAG: SDR family NAD(P)-dependent oxidoreductase [Planctomycetota bacterium]|jgi:NAD(P)-dependent dehydrogenase (short-subunit alcohol dehydrogenase family)
MVILFGDKGGFGRYYTTVERPYGDDCFKSPRVVTCNREQCNIERPDDVYQFFADTLENYPAWEPLYVINATGKNISGFLHKQDPADFEAVWHSNVLGSWNILQQFARHAKGRTDASCLFLSSICAVRQTVPGVTAYAAAKAGLEGLVKAAAPELARNGARVNAVRMGYFDCGMKETIPHEIQKKIKETIPLQKWGEPGHLRNLINNVLINTYMTGSIIDITGGL